MIQHEDGTGRVDAVSFVSLADADAYHALRVNTAWAAAEEPAREAALVKATDWIVANFGEEWAGVQTFPLGLLPFPRTGLVNPATGYVYELGEMPKAIIYATCELALEALAGALYNNTNPGSPQVIEDTIGPITTKYNPRNPLDLTIERNFSFVRAILKPLLGSVGRPLLTLVRG